MTPASSSLLSLDMRNAFSAELDVAGEIFISLIDFP